MTPIERSSESPWYLVRAGKLDEARQTLEYLYGSELEANEKLANIIGTTNEETKLQKPSYVSAFKNTDRVRTWISIGVFACQHAISIIFVLSFSTYFFQLAGLDTTKALDLGVGVTACGVAGNIVSWFIVNRFGRRIIFLSGMVGCTLLLLLIGVLDVVPSDATKWVQATLTVIYSFVYFLTISAVAFVLLGEVSSLALRARTTALATATQAIFGIIMFFAVLYMVNPDAGNLKGKVGFIFGGLAAFASVVCFFYIPELKGRTYSEIDAMFVQRVPPRAMGYYKLASSPSGVRSRG